MQARVLLIVKGMVQGVGFRFFAQRAALKRKLNGFVRNVPDGSVESMVEGEKGLIEGYIADLKSGSSLSHVDEVEVRWGTYAGEFKDFQITS